MRIKIDKEVGSHLFIIGVASMGLWVTRTWPYETALFPKITTYAILIFALLSLFVELRKKKKKGETATASILKPGVAKNAVNNFGWLAGYVIGTWLLGYIIASLLYVFLYIKVKGKQGWLTAILVTLGAFLFLEVVFVILLKIRLLPGVLWSWFGL